ncbi:helicase domino-like [Diaphorina citri]|uniref:Helicase domino-like n=1 Tax=Diaphorina citri TaxID=121845 RepID=A0A3Q0IJM6_DIACI|nr:helicase domino-like [Diaphorina citri]
MGVSVHGETVGGGMCKDPRGCCIETVGTHAKILLDMIVFSLISEKTIEENILRKANQKRLLGDLAIEGGNFTTAFFKSSTIQDLFNTEGRQESDASTRLADVLDPTPPQPATTASQSQQQVAAVQQIIQAQQAAQAGQQLTVQVGPGYENVLIAREEGKLMYDPSPKKHKTKNKLQIFTKIPQVNIAHRYENVLIAREEGKLMYDPSPKKHKTKNKLQIFTKIPQLKSGRSMRTAQLYAQDNNLTLTSLLVARYEAMHAIIDRRTPTTQSFKPLLVNSATNQVRSVQSVVAASSQQVATGQQIRTSAVTTAVVMSSSTQPIVTTRMITGSPAGTTTKPLTPSQLQLYKQQQLRQQQLRLLQQKAVAAAQVQQVVSSGGSVIQQTSSPVTIRAQAKPRTVTDAEMAILKRQMLQQAAAQQQSATQKAAVGSLLAQTSGAIQPGTQVTTLVKTLPPQTAGIIPQVKTLSAAQIKPTAAQFRQIQFQQQLIAQRKASSAAPTGGTTTAKVVKAAGVGGTTQLIVAGGGKSLTGTMTMQQIQQVIKQQIPHAGTINVSTSSGQVISHAVITKSPQVQQRTVIPVATSVSVAGAKQTIQVSQRRLRAL